ncbi:MAG: HlyD family type I secretion periplasmic adaptor subunit, partial [Paracoccaceae bacterium]|nr:HlyD family type I secretion periplasmic adaptor subunit [Paracoccaceae bacterium]
MRFRTRREDPTPATGPVQRPTLSRRDREFLPAAIEILETPPAIWAVALTLVLCLFVVVALAWAYFGRLDISATAPGKLEAIAQERLIQPRDDGRVSTINVRNGSHVKVGDVLVALDPTEARADLATASNLYRSLRAEATRRQAAIVAARSIALSAESAATVHVPEISPSWSADIPREFQDREAAVLAADIAQLNGDLDALTRQIAEKDATKEKLQNSIAVENGLIETLKARVAMWQSTVKLQVGSKVSLFDAEESLGKTQASLADAKGQLAETAAALSELGVERQKLVAHFLDDNQTRLAEVLSKADDAHEQLVKAENKLARLTLTSPIDGVVQELAVTTLGQVVTTGQQLMLISPEGSSLRVVALVKNDDIGFIRLGQSAIVKVDAFPFTRFGTLHGKVRQIATQAIDEEDAKREQA